MRAGKLYGYTSAVGAIGQAMGITVRAPRHAHACVDVTEPAPPAAAATATATLNRGLEPRGHRKQQRARHRSLFCTPSAVSRLPPYYRDM